MPSKKLPVSKNASAKAAPVKTSRAAKTAPAAPAAVYRLKVDLANLAVGAKTLKQLSRAVGKLAQTLTRMEEGGNVSLEQPVTAKGAHLSTQDAKLARRFGMEEGRAPRSAKTAAPAKKAAAKKAAAKKTRTQATAADAAPAAEAATTTALAKKAAAKKAAAKKAPAKKAAGKKAARKTGANGAGEPQRAADGESAAAPEAPPATDMPGSEITPP